MDQRQHRWHSGSKGLIVAKEIAGINLIRNISQLFRHTVRNDDISFLLKGIQIANDARIKEFIFLHHRFVNNNRDTFGFNTLHNPLD